MFNKKREKDMAKKGNNGNGLTPAVNLLSEGTEIQGEIQSNDDIRIDGTLKGTIHSKAKVVIGSTGKVEGNIYCQSADVLGYIDGTVNVDDILFLKSSAKISGDIKTGKLVVESGATFDGNCNMGGNKQQQSNDQQPEPKQKQQPKQGAQQQQRAKAAV